MHENKIADWDAFAKRTVSAGIKSFIARRQDFCISEKLPYDIFAGNFSLHQEEINDIFFDIIRQDVVKILYSVYVADETDESVFMPKTWLDFIKHGFKTKWPSLFKSLTVEFVEHKTIKRTLFPLEQVTTPVRKFMSYTSGPDL